MDNEGLKVILVVGARPNFIKISPIINAMRRANEKGKKYFQPLLVHTGQHYDYNMSKVFFEDLELPEPDIHLGIGGGTHAEQTGKTMIEFEKVVLNEKPDLVLVVGDVNATLAASLVASKLHIPVAHVEAGLRSNDFSMPEEVNRVLTDHISDYLFTTSKLDDAILKKEGIGPGKIYCVGNTMVDCLMSNIEKASLRPVQSRLDIKENNYAVLTLHRPANVDDPANLKKLLDSITKVAEKIPVVFPIHPRTQKRLKESGISDDLSRKKVNLKFIEPLGYLDFICLVMKSRFVMTDSGGLQSETTILNVPCLTLRETTEWKITQKYGTNLLIGEESAKLENAVNKILSSKGRRPVSRIPLWDGNTSGRIIDILMKTKN